MLPNKVKVAGVEYDVREIDGINDRFNTLGMVNYQVLKDNKLYFGT